MLRIIKGGLTSGCFERIKSEILEITERSERSILIVPEQQTVTAEAEMSAALPDFSPKYFDATNFTRLANSAFRSLGGICGEYCDKTKKALIMWRALTELSPVLTMTEGRRDISAGLVERAMSAVSDMQVQGIAPSELAEYAEHEEVLLDKRLAGKLSDLARIYSTYKHLLSEKYADTADDIARMAEKLEQHPDYLSDTAIFIDGFTSFTEPQYALISRLLSRTCVTVCLTIPKAASDGFEYTEMRNTEEHLKRLARRAGSDIKIFFEDTNRAVKSEAVAQLTPVLFRNYAGFDNITLQNPEEMRVFESRTPFEMCEFVAADIRRRVIAGARYRDFAIVARDAEKYSGILDTALSRAGVSAFTSKKSDAESFEAIKLIYTAYAVARGGFAREDVLTYAKCGLSGITREECDELESYVGKWDISGSRFTDGLAWNMNPDGYTTRKNERTAEKLRRINDVRDRLVAPLYAFSEDVGAAKCVRDHAEILTKFLLDIKLSAALERKAASLESFGEHAAAEDNRKLWALICDGLDTLVEVSGDFPADADSFQGQLRIVFSSAQIGRIPAYYDEVTVGSADMLRLYRKSHVYLIGANAGEFPAAPTDSSYFTERDKITLSLLGLGVKPDIEIRSSKELFFFARAFSYAEESVTVLYSACDNAFKSIQRSDVVEKLIARTGINAIRISSLHPSERIWSASAALEELSALKGAEREAVKQALVDSGHEWEVAVSESEITNASLALGESSRERLIQMTRTLSQTALDEYLNCPLSYFCKYTVKLSDDSSAQFDARNVGSFVHSILENFFRTLNEKNLRADMLTREDKERLTREAAGKYVEELGEVVTLGPSLVKMKIDRLCRAALPVVDGLCDEFANSKYLPRYFELKLDSPDGPGDVFIKSENTGTIRIRGTIDRVDTFSDGDDVFVRVVDYKTGQKDFSPEDMSEGRNLQMFLYLDAIVESRRESFVKSLGAENGGRLIPAGVIYVKTSVGDVQVDMPSDSDAEQLIKDGQRREGMLLENSSSIDAMGLRYTPLYSKRFPNKIVDQKRKFLYTEDGWGEIMTTVRGAVADIADGIRSGNAAATPSVNNDGNPHCEYCDFKPICRKVSRKHRK